MHRVCGCDCVCVTVCVCDSVLDHAYCTVHIVYTKVLLVITKKDRKLDPAGRHVQMLRHSPQLIVTLDSSPRRASL